MSAKPPVCKACTVPLEDHDGHEKLCRKLARARSALCIIGTWANFPDPFNQVDVALLVDRVVRELDE